MVGINARRVCAIIVALTMIVTACGDDSASDDAATNGDATTQTSVTTTTVPQRGGVLTMGVFSETMGLDPVVSSGSTLGGTEMTAIYDTIMRWNPDTGNYEPRTAESLTPNADFTRWTLKIRSGIKFSDGTSYDAAAVQFALDRQRAGQPDAPPCQETRACPRSTSSAAGFASSIRSMTVTDSLTLTFDLREPLPSFPAVLASEAGMVPSPTAVKNTCPADASQAARLCPFNLAPVGAGPFVIDSFKPKDSITMKRNPDYWGGTVYLDGLKFVDLVDGGGDRTYDALKTGTIHVAFLRVPWVVAQAREENTPGYAATYQASQVILFNNGRTVACSRGQPPVCAGRPDGPFDPNPPTKNAKVRQAIAAAFDARVVNERAYQGKGLPGTELFQKDFAFYPGTPGPAFDTTKAKQLVEEAKAEGWNGVVRYRCGTSQFHQQRALALQTMLQAVGITVQVNNTSDNVVGDVTTGDFDLACFGLSFASDDLLSLRLFNALASNSPSNRVGYKNTEMDAALTELKRAPDAAAKKAALAKISTLYVRDVPFVVEAATTEYMAWQSKVHGIYANQATELFFDKAWISG